MFKMIHNLIACLNKVQFSLGKHNRTPSLHNVASAKSSIQLKTNRHVKQMENATPQLKINQCTEQMYK